MRRTLLLLALAGLPWTSAAQTPTTPVPQSHIPSTVVLQLRALEGQFDQALVHDCAPERCFSRGCVYQEHVAVDLPRSGSLPGLGQTEGPGSVPVQEYLTRARCDFSHEKSVPTKDVQALVKRIEQKLSKGWLQVTVGRQLLEPVSASLRESPADAQPQPVPVKPEPPPPPPAPPPKWEAEVALRELWVSLLPHFFWMIALVLGTLATLIVIWGLRRVGRESLEEKALLAQLAAGGAPKGSEAEPPASATEPEPQPETPPPSAQPTPEEAQEGAFVQEQQRVWHERIAQAELAKNESVVAEMLREWLKKGEFALLAKAIFVFGDRLSLAFSSDGELALRKVEFAEFLRSLDEKALPSDADFFRTLNHHAISSSVLSQADAEIYRSLREDFGSTGLVRLIESLSPRYGALLFGQVSPDYQHEVGRLMRPELAVRVADQLLLSNRISKEEMGHLMAALSAARAGQPLPATPVPATHGISDRGRPFEAASALSVLLPRIDPTHRQALFAKALERASGAFPIWYEDILYPDMLLKIPPEMKADLLLEVDVRGLAGWSSVQHPSWQETFIGGLAPTMQNAVRGNMAFGSRSDQLRHAQRGRNELVSAMKKLVSSGKVSFSDIVS